VNNAVRNFSRVLVANRGEIAVRVMRTARELGLHSIAVYSEADAGALHVAAADESYLLGSAPAAESYLNIQRVMEAARVTGAQAIHPGYGFLSENPQFAEACESAGLVFVGPPAAAVKSMGNKAAAKRLMEAAGVPCVPGFQGTDQSDESLIEQARHIGVPLMVKAAAGGGGRGMRQVDSLEQLPQALNMARAEAQSAFGNDELILEKLVENARHVEVQVFADSYGTTVHLGERDCSVQRRHQKVLEESPSPAVDARLRESMGNAACAAARAVDYRGAGTVEFLLGDNGEFYFLEMNTRLQVEHPVTEMVTGLDLVALQFKVARGDALPFNQDDVSLTGHAIEARLYAENPGRKFLPGPGRVNLWRAPTGAGVRVDSGIATNCDVTPYYDPLLAKIIAHGPDRDTARRRLVSALRDTLCFGLPTNRAFLSELLQSAVFADGEATTGYVDGLGGGHAPSFALPTPLAHAVMAVIEHELAWREACGATLYPSAELRNFTGGMDIPSHHVFDAAGTQSRVTVHGCDANEYEVRADAQTFRVTLVGQDDGDASMVVDGRQVHAAFCVNPDGYSYLALGIETFRLKPISSTQSAGAQATALDGPVVAPVPGKLVELNVASGDKVRAEQHVLTIEAMKMRHEVRATRDGTVGKVFKDVGVQVVEREPLLELDK
jgi:geranyl-CoA carboxylase alpha subunit